MRILLEFCRRRGLQVTYVLIVGSNNRAVEFARSIESKMELGYQIIGFVDDGWPGMKKFRTSGYDLVAGFRHSLQIWRTGSEHGLTDGIY